MVDKNFIKQALKKMKNNNRLTVSKVNEKFYGVYVGNSLFSRNIYDFKFLVDEKLIIGLPMGNKKRSSIVFQITAKGKQYLEGLK